jgi:hypothetical protein
MREAAQLLTLAWLQTLSGSCSEREVADMDLETVVEAYHQAA